MSLLSRILSPRIEIATYRQRLISKPSPADDLHTQLAKEVAEHGPLKPKDCPKLQRIGNGRFMEVG